MLLLVGVYCDSKNSLLKFSKVCIFFKIFIQFEQYKNLYWNLNCKDSGCWRKVQNYVSPTKS